MSFEVKSLPSREDAVHWQLDCAEIQDGDGIDVARLMQWQGDELSV